MGGKKAIRPTDLEEPNYTFEGWYEESTCTTVYDFNKTVNSNITLYAKWKLNIITDGMVNKSQSQQCILVKILPILSFRHNSNMKKYKN